MSAFNTSTRKEDISVRLKSQNIRHAKEQTRQLEVESKKMEERLKELKMAMSREKEERERQGGFWRAGQTGTLHSYADEVLAANPSKQPRDKSGSGKVKILKDEPINVPQRSKGPGTMGYIASRKVSPKENRNDKHRGHKCGQCEERGASVTCIQCAEDYCAGCFALFHVKGALKKHRSVPLQANTPRQCFTPRLTPPTSSREPVSNHLPAEAADSYKRNGVVDRNSPEGASGSFDSPSLLAGNYNEADSAASFQAALQAWRSGPEDDGQTQSIPTPKHQPQRKPVNTSPVKTAVVSVEHGTSMTDTRGDNPVEITFNTHSVSYAEKLLLKKHRQTDIGEFPGNLPSIGVNRSADTSQNTTSSYYDLYDEDPYLSEPRDHMDFQAMYQAVKCSEVESRAGTGSGLSIIELPDIHNMPGAHGFEESSHCSIEEVEDAPGALFSSRSTKNTKSGSRPAFGATQKPPSSRQKRRTREHSAQTKSKSEPYITEPPEEPPTSVELPAELEEIGAQSNGIDNISTETTQDPLVSQNRPPSAKSRPQSRVRPKSSARPKSRAGSQLGSRVASRLSQFGEGNLTKTPTSALQTVARLSQHTPVQPLPTLDMFFLAGVDTGGANQERTLTPTKNKHQDVDNHFKISNRLYQMAPRSWRPDSSVGEAVPMDQVRLQAGADEELALSYTYSGQMEGSPIHTHSHPSSRSLSEADQTNLSVRPPSTPKERSRYSPRDNRIISPGSARNSVLSRQETSGRISRAIVVDGEDMSGYDEDRRLGQTEQTHEDEQTLGRLEWELASETGRITGDGKISRLSVHSPEVDPYAEDVEDLVGRISSLSQHGPGYDIHSQLRADELMDDFEEMERKILDEEDVKALT